MSGWLMGFVGVIYVFTSISLWFEGKPGLSIAFAGYAFSQVGLIWAAR